MSRPASRNSNVQYGGRGVRAGWLRVLVARQTGGRGMDRYEALATLAHQPWHADLVWCASTARHHVFERPGPTVKAVRGQHTFLTYQPKRHSP